MKNRLYYGDNLEILRNREYDPIELTIVPPQHGTLEQAEQHSSGDGKSQQDSVP